MKQLTLLLFFVIPALTAMTQDLTVTKYFDKNGDSTGKENAFSYNVVTYTDSTKKVYTVQRYTIKGHLNSEICYRDSGKTWQYDGNYITYHENGKPKIKG